MGGLCWGGSETRPSRARCCIIDGMTQRKNTPKGRSSPQRDSIRRQPRLISTPEELATLERLRSAGRVQEIAKFLDKRARKVLGWWKAEMRIHSGRPRKRPQETAGLLCAARVEGRLPIFHHAIERKRLLQRKFRTLSQIKAQLIEEGHHPEEAEIAVSSRTAFEAACAWVARNDWTVRSPRSVANYHRLFRHLLWRYAGAAEGPREPRDAKTAPRIVVDLAPYFLPATENPR